MSREFTAVVRRDGDWWIGWIEEIPGVNAQELTQEDLSRSLKSALEEALEFYREDARAAAGGIYSEIKIAI
jgi:predicted RNase H-like HicB family nuclease